MPFSSVNFELGGTDTFPIISKLLYTRMLLPLGEENSAREESGGAG